MEPLPRFHVGRSADACLLLVEDDPEVSKTLVRTLAAHGFSILTASSGAEIGACLNTRAIDLLILDLMLPGEDGLEICRHLRTASEIPILILSALTSSTDRVVGLEMGADDYMSKPFDTRELVARVRALLRRARSAGINCQKPLVRRYNFEGWCVEPIARRLHNPEGAHVALTSAEFDLLLAFCRNPGRVLSRERLLELTHSGTAGPMERSIDVHVSRIRQKLQYNARGDDLLKTVRLGGYIFTPEVEAL